MSAEATDGKFQIVAHAAGELASSQQALDAVSSGSVECAHTPAYFYFNKVSALGFGTGFPFGLNSRQQLSWWTFGGGGDIVNSALKRLNVHGIPAGLTGVQMGAWFKKEINSLDDLKGLRFRISGMGGPVLARVGAAPQHIPHSDVYAALERGTIDAAEFISPYDDEKLGLPKVAKFNYFPCWWESGGMIHMVVNLEKWNALPKAYQSALARACDAACSWMLAKYDSVNPAGAQTASSLAVPCSSPSRNRSWRPCYRATKDHAAELSGKDIHFKRAFELHACLPQGAAALVADLRARLRQLHAEHARTRVRRAPHLAPVKAFSSGVQQSA